MNEIITTADKDNLFSVLQNTWQQVEYSWSVPFDASPAQGREFSNVIVSGLGGSAIAADLLRDYLGEDLRIPYSVNRNYHIPASVGTGTLLIISSYSGNTEESISALREGLSAGCTVLCITTGGVIGEIASSENLAVFRLKPGFQPRFSLGLSFYALLRVFQSLGLIPNQDAAVHAIRQSWQRRGIEWMQPDALPLRTAIALLGSVPVIYSGAGVTESAGYRLKCQFNENAKMHAFHNVLPEMNHNEIIGWEDFSPSQISAVVVTLEDESLHPQIQKRFAICKRLFNGKEAGVISLRGEGETFRERLMDLVFLADWITCYAAVLRGKDPGEIDYIHLLKKELA